MKFEAVKFTADKIEKKISLMRWVTVCESKFLIRWYLATFRLKIAKNIKKIGVYSKMEQNCFIVYDIAERFIYCRIFIFFSEAKEHFIQFSHIDCNIKIWMSNYTYSTALCGLLPCLLVKLCHKHVYIKERACRIKGTSLNTILFQMWKKVQLLGLLNGFFPLAAVSILS